MENVILQEDFCERVREVLAAEDISQSELARRMKVSPQTVSQYLARGACPWWLV